MPERILLCARWDDPGTLKNRIKATCKYCDCEVGYDPLNAMRVEAEGYGFICMACFMEKFVKNNKPGVFGGSMVGGRMYDNALDGLRAAKKRHAEEDKHDA